MYPSTRRPPSQHTITPCGPFAEPQRDPNALPEKPGICKQIPEPVNVVCEQATILRHAFLDSRSIHYTSKTKFLVQVGKGPKGSYKTKYAFTGNLGQCMIHYNGINLGNGYKKRVIMVDAANPVLCCERS